MSNEEQILSFLTRLEALLKRAEYLLPQEIKAIDWDKTLAARWKRKNGCGALYPVHRPHMLSLDSLVAIDDQKERIDKNTRQFVEGGVANNVLLTGAPGTGKSSLVKAMLQRYAQQGLRLIEVDRNDLFDLPDIVAHLDALPQRFVIFCDDLAFDSQESGYRELKAVLDGSIMAPPDNVLIYATSNRRHLMPTFFHENFTYHENDTEIRPGEGKDEKVSLAERFGLWISFYNFSEDDYWQAVNGWLQYFGVALPQTDQEREALRLNALQWARMRGAVSGRVAWQFARDYVGGQALTQHNEKS
jgi:Predicted ATPase (AAA+ superfamily)